MLKVATYSAKVDREAAFANTTLDGEPFVYRRTTKTYPNRASNQYVPSLVELNILIDALAPSKDIPRAVWSIKPTNEPTPDFKLSYEDRDVFCECTSAGDQASRIEMTSIADLQLNIDTQVGADERVLKRLGNHYVAFIPSKTIRPDDIADAAKEIRSFIVTEDLSKYSSRYGIRAPEQYSTLRRSDTIVALRPSQGPHVIIQAPARSGGGPRETLHDLLRAIKRKQTKGYSTLPLWLAIGTSNVIWPLNEDLVRDLVARLDDDISPFERVYLSNSLTSTVLSAE